MVITKTELESGKHNKQIKGVVLIKSYAKKPTKNGGEYVDGLLMSEVTVPFKVWSSSPAFSRLTKEDFSNCPTYIAGTWNEYQGNMSIQLDSVEAVEGYDPIDFMETKYDGKGYMNALISMCERNTSAKGMEVLNTILFNNEEMVKRFSMEFAAMGNHDNCKSGLVAHTYKVICLMSWVLKTYEDLLDDGNHEGTEAEIAKRRADRRDLLMVGACLHDIGKIDEMHYGTYQPNSAISHRILGLDYLYEARKQIETLYDTKWYRDLQSILVEHHDEWADPCRTVVSYVVNKVDVMDAQLTGLAQLIANKTTTNTAGVQVYMDNRYLTL